jgi:hypothetical protein
MRRTLISAALLSAALAPAASADTGTLSSTAYGAVDFGDTIAYRVTGAGCESIRPQVVITLDDAQVTGVKSQPRVDGVDPSGCTGAATVPSWNDVRAAGYEPGDQIEIDVRAGDQRVPLRYFRIEADRGEIAAGAPTIGPADDQDTGDNDSALTMSKGDSVSLGRVDLKRVEAMSLRLCVTGADGVSTTSPAPLPVIGSVGGRERIEPPVIASIRQGSPTGPELIGPVDVSSNPTNVTRLATSGWGGCYRLLHLPVTGRTIADSPELFVTVEAALPGVLQLNSVDVDGTAAKIPAPAETDPAGMRTIFDGSSFDGWTQTGCRLGEDGSASNLRTGSPTEVSPCSLTWNEQIKDAVFRFDIRRKDLFDNGGVLLGHAFPAQIQLRSLGEYGAGGYNGLYPARALKLNTWPDWSHVQIAQLGARFVVTINGRTITDVVRPDGAPAPYNFAFSTEPEWSFRTGASNGFGTEAAPDAVRPTEWGDYWFRNARVLDCDGPEDPVCVALSEANVAQAPKQ